jgi:hypothetical protein
MFEYYIWDSRNYRWGIGLPIINFLLLPIVFSLLSIVPSATYQVQIWPFEDVVEGEASLHYLSMDPWTPSAFNQAPAKFLVRLLILYLT